LKTLAIIGLGLCALVATACGGGTASCRPGTILVTVNFDDVTSNADSIVVDVSLNGMPARTSSWARTADAGATTSVELEVDFPHGYYAGDALSFTISAVKDGQIIATYNTGGRLPQGCGFFTVDLALDGGTD
jgi:hypothetical protein